MLNMTQRGKHCHLVWRLGWCSDKHSHIVPWRWLWLREANSVISCDVQRGKHCRLVLRSIRPRGKLRWKCVKKWWMPKWSKHKWRHKEKKAGGLLSGFRFLSGGLMLGRWAFVPLPGQVYPKEKLTHFLSRQEPEHFPLGTVLPRSFSPCIIRL